MTRTLLLVFSILFLAGCASLKERNASLQERNSRLQFAAYIGDNETVKQMLAGGAQIGAKDKFGDSPLHLAIKHKHPDIAALLISRGANVNQVNALGDTPLHISAYTKQQELTQLLRSKGALDSILNQYGLNPNEMESLPETEAAVAEVTAFLSQDGRWTKEQTARRLFYELKKREQKFLVNALVLQVIRTRSIRIRTIILSIKLGIQGSEDKLGSILMVYGTDKMAEDYLNSGSSTLHQWGTKWASANGYNIQTAPGSRRITWGSF